MIVSAKNVCLNIIAMSLGLLDNVFHKFEVFVCINLNVVMIYRNKLAVCFLLNVGVVEDR